MSALDILILVVLVFGFVRGVFKGFVLELAGFVGIILSIYVARFYSGIILNFLESFFGIGKEIAPIFAFLITFLLTILACHFFALLADKFLNLIALGWLNKLLGGFLSLAKYLLIVSVLINLFELANTRLDLFEPGFQTKSKLYHPMKKIAPTVLPCIDMDDITGKLHGVFSNK